MRERLGYRLSAMVFSIDVVATLVCLLAATQVRLRINLGQELTWREVRLPWLIYLVVAILWTAIFLLMGTQRRLLNRGLIETIGRLVASVGLASLTFAGLLYLTVREVSRLQFIYFTALDLFALVLIHLLVRS
ncbi:MAG: hypothetical protein WCG26_06435, partial [Chloroflexales bacterium]